MDTYIDQVRAALADDASDDAHQAGATACRAILAAIDARRATTAGSNEAGRATPPIAPPTPPQSPASRTIGDLPALVAIRAATREQILDHVIARLKALQPQPQTGASITSVISAFRNLSLDQILDLGLARLQAALAPRPALAPTLPDGARVIRLAPAPVRR